MNDNHIFNSLNYIHYMCQYQGKYTKKTIENNVLYITILNNDFAILSLKSDLIKNIGDTNLVRNISNQVFSNDSDFLITYVLPPMIYTLQEISAISATNVESLQINLPLQLEGKDVIIGILDTGIDYLNEEFTDSNGNTRILSIWDQTIPSKDEENTSIPFGMNYTKDEINNALNLSRNGGNPYDIVPSKDENGHGTKMAGIVGASGKNPKIKGIANKCEFAIIKLLESISFKNTFEIKVPIYELFSIMPAMEYLKNIFLTTGKPVVILLPLGSNNGNHRGEHLLNSYIESLTNNIGIAVVTGTGNEGLQDNHVSGFIKNTNDEGIVELIVSPNQKFLFMDFWGSLPNIFEINIISPSGEETEFIPAILNTSKRHTYIFEKTEISVYYYLPEEYSGEELIRVYFANIQPGIWRLKLKLRLGKIAKYDMWMSQSGIKEPETRFTPSNPYGTFTIPSDSNYTVSVASYNQNNKTVLSYSGMSFIDDSINIIDFAAGGESTLTTGLGNKLDTISGTCLSAAIGAGACALLFQWGIIEGNYPYMHSESLKTFLQRGTIRRRGDTYPNAQWGYGIIDFYSVFLNISSV